MTRKKISAHFSVEEFDCHDGTRVPSSAFPALVKWATEWGEPMRREFGVCTVLSGYRTPRYNRSVGGASASYHLNYVSALRAAEGLAADLTFARGTPRDWYRWALAERDRRPRLCRAGRGGIGLYVASNFVHLDTGPARVWNG